MTQETPVPEIQAFYAYLGRRLQNGGDTLSPEESLREFRTYRQELESVRAKIAEAEESSRRGLSKPLDLDAVKERLRRRLAAEGIAE